MAEKHTNALIKAQSPYLLQHAHNPVNWMEWGEEAFNKAEKEGKLVLVSIGYASCHWCHVMEKESFEDEEVAALMNEHFICIKVDREERPDIDQTYMKAVQMMTKHGGWPLNCFALPDKRPIYGATYFPKPSWIEVLNQLKTKYKEHKEEVLEYAKLLTQEMLRIELIDLELPKINFNDTFLHNTVEKWKPAFDIEEGGNKGVPKFLLPNNLLFLLQYGVQLNDQETLNHVHHSLKKMALGGIYDQLGGGFSRYSTDQIWKVPHFEKMLYDNGQMLSLYAKAYQQKKKILYKDTIEGIVDWLIREMHDKNEGFYSGLDADSEGVEGKFYTWSDEELSNILEDDFGWFSTFYNINETGHWKDHQFILYRTEDKGEWCAEKSVSIKGLEIELSRAHKKLMAVRSKRTPPNLDDKQLTSWNAMIVKGLVDAGIALGKDNYIEQAIKTGNWILDTQYNKKDNSLWRTHRNGQSTIDGFLEDYAHTIDAFITLYEATFDEKWITIAKQLLEYTIEHFYDQKGKMFYYSKKGTDRLFQKTEINDSVIPSSNSVMGNNLIKMSTFFFNDSYKSMAKQMLSNIYKKMESYGPAYSNWGVLGLYLAQKSNEIVLTGEHALNNRKKLGDYYLPNTIFSGGNNSQLPIAKGKLATAEGSIYICENFTCQAPVKNIPEALAIFNGK